MQQCVLLPVCRLSPVGLQCHAASFEKYSFSDFFRALLLARCAQLFVHVPLLQNNFTPNAAMTKPARELYVGGIPHGISALQLQQMLSQLYLQLSGGAGAPGNPIVTAWLSADQSYAFVEFRSSECSSPHGSPCYCCCCCCVVLCTSRWLAVAV